MGISAASVPQWIWSTDQCQTWFFSILVTYLNYSKADAAATAIKLQGFGPTLYLRTASSWGRLVGIDNGEGIEALLLTMSNKDGAVPPGIKILWK